MVPEKGARVATVLAREAGVPLKIAAKMREPSEQQFFAEGLTNQLITQLAAVRTLRVVSGLAARQARRANARNWVTANIRSGLAEEAEIKAVLRVPAGELEALEVESLTLEDIFLELHR